MDLDYVLVDVFAEARLAGNALAVFPDAPGLPDELMQAIARELNLSETVFVTTTRPLRYASRIFTPGLELPFAGHPTLGTAWVLRDIGRLTDGPVLQETKAGETAIQFDGDKVWLERIGDGGDDDREVAAQLGPEPELIGFEWPDAGGVPVELHPAIADAGIPQLIVPFKSPDALEALEASEVKEPPGTLGTYCFSFSGSGEVSAKFFGQNAGVAEDPATGSAAAALGLYLGQRLGEGRVTISQGTHLGRASRLHVEYDRGRVKVGGRVIRVGRGVLTLDAIPADKPPEVLPAYPGDGEIEVSARCLACGEIPDRASRCHPDPARVEKLQWYRDQPSFELREHIGSGHVVAVRRDQTRSGGASKL